MALHPSPDMHQRPLLTHRSSSSSAAHVDAEVISSFTNYQDKFPHAVSGALSSLENYPSQPTICGLPLKYLSYVLFYCIISSPTAFVPSQNRPAGMLRSLSWYCWIVAVKPTRRQLCWTWITIPCNRWDNDDNGNDDYDELGRRKRRGASVRRTVRGQCTF